MRSREQKKHLYIITRQVDFLYIATATAMIMIIIMMKKDEGEKRRGECRHSSKDIPIGQSHAATQNALIGQKRTNLL